MFSKLYSNVLQQKCEKFYKSLNERVESNTKLSKIEKNVFALNLKRRKSEEKLKKIKRLN